MSNELAGRQCEACGPGSPQVGDSERADLMTDLPNWSVDRVDGMDQLAAEYRFADFAAALEFVNRVGELAEAENHHPKLVLEWGRAEGSLVDPFDRRAAHERFHHGGTKRRNLRRGRLMSCQSDEIEVKVAYI